jgi:hypothetical protein
LAEEEKVLVAFLVAATAAKEKGKEVVERGGGKN